jgi:2-oxoisovalerate dehydrogenase E1 component beta subunit
MYAPLVIRGPAGGGTHGGPWNSASPEAWFAHAPGLKVVMPSTPYDAKGLLKAAIRDNNPVLFLEHRYLYRRSREELPAEDYIVPIGQAEVRRNGPHVSVITYGAMVYHALDAAEQLAAEGIDAEVIDLRTLAPLDRVTITDSVRQTSKAVIVHEASKTGGLGAEIAAGIAEDCFDALDGPVLRIAAPDVPYPAALELEDAYLPSVAQIIAAAKQLAAY